MNNNTIEIIKKTLVELENYHSYLLTKKLSEPCINHQIACILSKYFKNHAVDCEYNRNVANKNEKKRFEKQIHFTVDELNKVSKNPAIKKRLVIPDIIIHKRGETSGNLIIIETKRRTNNKTELKEFDQIKLSRYTQSQSEFHYETGIYIELDDESVGEERKHLVIIYKNGEAPKNYDIKVEIKAPPRIWKGLIEPLCN